MFVNFIVESLENKPNCLRLKASSILKSKATFIDPFQFTTYRFNYIRGKLLFTSGKEIQSKISFIVQAVPSVKK